MKMEKSEFHVPNRGLPGVHHLTGSAVTWPRQDPGSGYGQVANTNLQEAATAAPGLRQLLSLFHKV